MVFEWVPITASTDWIEADQAASRICVISEAALGPVLWVIQQLSFQRIHLRVVQLFDSLLPTPHILLGGWPGV